MQLAKVAQAARLVSAPKAAQARAKVVSLVRAVPATVARVLAQAVQDKVAPAAPAVPVARVQVQAAQAKVAPAARAALATVALAARLVSEAKMESVKVVSGDRPRRRVRWEPVRPELAALPVHPERPEPGWLGRSAAPEQWAELERLEELGQPVDLGLPGCPVEPERLELLEVRRRRRVLG